jgi:hypothetical protein
VNPAHAFFSILYSAEVGHFLQEVRTKFRASPAGDFSWRIEPLEGASPFKGAINEWLSEGLRAQEGSLARAPRLCLEAL